MRTKFDPFGKFIDLVGCVVSTAMTTYYTVHRRIKNVYYKTKGEKPPTDIIVSKNGDHFVD